MNEDDLPVLTQVLRTGSGHTEAPLPAPVQAPVGSDQEALDVRPVEETWMADQLVIGNEPNRLIDDYLMQSFDGREATAEPIHDASVLRSADSFQLPQDNDIARADEAGGGSFGEPHLHEAAEHQSVDAQPTPVPPEDPAALTLLVRDAVLEGLRTRIDTELDARIAQALHAEVETALAQLQVNLRAHLTDALRDVVRRAVDEEIARIAAPSQPDGAA